MVLYGWWYLIGVAGVVVFWGLFIAPAERAHHKRRLEMIQRRIRDKERRRAGSTTERRQR